MITKDKALQMVPDRLGPDSGVMPDDTVEREYGWVIFSQSREFIKTGDPMMMDIGSDGVLIEKATGKRYDFGSAHSTDENLHIYEQSYLQFNKWDLVGRPCGLKLP